MTPEKALRSPGWALENPWFWMGLALALLLPAWVLKLLDVWPERLILILPGLLAGAGAVIIRLNSRRPSYVEDLSRPSRSAVLLGLALVFGSMFLALSAWLILRIAGRDWLPGKPGQLVVVWAIAAPVSALAFRVAWRHLGKSEVHTSEESAAILALAGLVCALACWSLAWPTMQLLLAVMAFAALVAAPLMMVSQNARRWLLSLLVVLHFGGIATAVLAAPPTPWIIDQLWKRIYRPYLQFMYLKNAYHFYSPEPGPASYLWFRLIYLDKNDQEHGVWYKIPDVDDKGRSRYPLALQYNRFLALTENASYPTSVSFLDMKKVGEDWKPVKAGFVVEREKYSPGQAAVLGKDTPPAGSLLVPFHPLFPENQQYSRPLQKVKEIVQSYAQHVARMPHPEHPEWRIAGVKVYLVKHQIPPEGPFIKGVDPREPYFYLPYYLGMYNQAGQLLDRNSPFLYWLLPIIEPEHGGYMFDWARRHAGDPLWVRDPTTKKWVKPTER